MKFTKLQGLGNDFVLFDARRSRLRTWPEMAQRICARRFGVGADGVLLLLTSEKADFRMRIFNPDGSEAEACGNGLRCLVRYISEEGLTDKNSLTIETKEGIRQANLLTRGGRVALFKVSMGKPVFCADKIPVLCESGSGIDFSGMLGDYPVDIAGRRLFLNFVSMGNPHAVHFLSEPVREFPLASVGSLVEKYRLFPRGTNFEIARMIGPDICEMRVWERGAGETLACGSGACAVAVAARLKGFCGEKLDIQLPGGVLEASWNGNGEVWLTGPAEIAFNGNWPV